MNSEKEFWERFYKNNKDIIPKYDLWLDKYKKVLDLSLNNYIVDLGCGNGGNTLYLSERGYKVIAYDFSNEALDIVKKFIPNVYTKNVDITQGIPLDNSSIKVVIADLSLHYFSKRETITIIKDIYRIIENEGYLLCRVNSIKDRNYGVGKGCEIEENFYYENGNRKRFFNIKDIKEFFSIFKIKHFEETKIEKYGPVKIAWELALQKKNSI